MHGWWYREVGRAGNQDGQTESINGAVWSISMHVSERPV